jgi:hypothetical protein
MKKTLLLCSFAVCSLLAQAQFPYSGTISTTDPTFNRPDPGNPPTTLSVQGTGVFYDVVPLVITAPGLYTITSLTSTVNFDMVGFLYGTGGFNPASPLNNVLLGDDDSGPGTLNFALTYNFTVAGTYTIVVTTYKPPLAGDYTLTLTEPGPLPVRVVSFTAEKSSGANLLKWATAGESDIVSYEVQHSSDGANFKNIAGGSVKALNVSTSSNYAYSDVAPFQKLNFYRLKITEKSGATTFSTVAVVNNGKNSSAAMSIFPNPAVNYLNIQTKTGQTGKAVVSIISEVGQIVYKSNYTLANQSIVNLDVKKLSAGRYIVLIETADGSTTNLPFVKY